MPIIIKTILGVLVSTLGKMAMKYLANTKVIEELIMYGLDLAVKATDSKVDDEILSKVKAAVEASNESK